MASKLDILINAKNNASPALKSVAGDLAGVDKFAGNAAKGLGGLAAGVGVAGIAALAIGVGGAAMEMGRASAAATDVATSFKGMAAAAGESGSAMLSALQTASRGAISDAELMLSANRSMLLGVADSSQEMAQLMDVARARSQAMGITTTQAFGDIVTGIGRMSPMILDNLGIVVDQARANEVYAQSIGTVASKLTDQEKKQALVNAVIRDSADLVAANVAAGDDAASNFERMDASIDNAKIALGELFSPALVAVANAMASAAAGATEAIKELGESGKLSNLAFDAEHAAGIILGLTRELEFLRQEEEALSAAHQKGSADWIDLQADIRATETQLRAAQDAQIAYSRAALIASASIGDFNHAQMEANLSLQNMNAASQAASSGLGRVGLSADALKERLAGLKAQSDATAAALASMESGAIGRLESAASGAVGAMGAGNVATQYGPAKEQLQAQIKALQQYGGDADWVKFKIEELAERAAAPFTNASDAARQAEQDAKKFATALGRDVTDAAKEAEAAFEGLRSKVAGVLSQALDTGTGVDPDEVLEKMGIPRADAINENARRLADIAANGLKGQDWLGAFRAEVPDIWNMIRTASNPQEEAAHLLNDFQDGLLTSAIDKSKAKQLVRRMLMGEASMAELALEIATELAAEMGVPLQQAMAAAQGALGVGGATGTAGTDAAQSFSDGAVVAMQGAGGGGAMVDAFIVQARAQYSKLSTAGADAGKAWGTAFLTTVGANVPPALINMLVNLVTPGVFAQIAQKGSLEGAVP